MRVVCTFYKAAYFLFGPLAFILIVLLYIIFKHIYSRWQCGWSRWPTIVFIKVKSGLTEIADSHYGRICFTALWCIEFSTSTRRKAQYLLSKAQESSIFIGGRSLVEKIVGQCLSSVWKNHSVNRRSCCAAACDSSCRRRFSSRSLRTSSSRVILRRASWFPLGSMLANWDALFGWRRCPILKLQNSLLC